MKIRNTLTYLFTIIVGSILIVFSFYIYFFYSQYRQKEFYLRLKEKALTTAKLLIGPKQIDQTLLKILDRRDLTVLHSEEIMIFNESNKEIYDSGNDTIPITIDFIEKVRRFKVEHMRVGDTEIIGVLYKDKLNKYVIVASAFDAYGFSKMKNLQIILIVGCTSSIVIVLTAGWFFSYKALQPMNDIVEQVDRITGSDLSKRVKSKKTRDEIAHLANTFNNMLARVQKTFDAQRSFVSNASHELRTPLTSITGQIEVILFKDREKEEYRAVLKSVLDDIRTLTELSNALLELARVSGDASALQPLNLRADELIWEARHDLIKKKPDYKVDVYFEDLPEDEQMFTIEGIENLLKIAILNLMENGCKFSPDKRVRVTLTVDQKTLKIRFEDQGIGIEEKELSNIFAPFYRGSNAINVNGHGVGLSLTKKIIGLHNGEIEVNSVLHSGTTFIISFPIADV